MVIKDYYKILDLEDNNVDIEEIKQAYRNQAKKYHPDRNKNNSEVRIQDINEAYKVLSDTASKRKYDRKWKVYIEKNRLKNKTYEAVAQDKTLKDEVYSMFFGDLKNKLKINKNNINNKGKTLPKIKGENIKTEISINLKEGFSGVKKYIALRDVKGTLRRIPIEIPLGIKNNDKLRIVGYGKPGLNGGKNGDLFINIKIEDDKLFKLQGKNIVTKINLYPWEVALGVKKEIEGINENLILNIPAGTQSGKRFEVPEKGYHDGFGGRGNLFIDVNIVMPEKMTDRELELYRKLEQLKKKE